MQNREYIKTVDIERTSRVIQVEGMFDLEAKDVSETILIDNLDIPDNYHIGCIVGPSGSGKTSLLEKRLGGCQLRRQKFSDTKSIIDEFPKALPIKEVVDLLSSVGFSSPPSWLRPYRVLSGGEQFRVSVARALAETNEGECCVIDEFTSVVDRTVAQIGSAAIAKSVRRYKRKLVVSSCHYDILEWLEPDWVYQPLTGEMSRRHLRRPKLEVQIRRVHRSAWELFRKHHYLANNIHVAARCFCAFLDDYPIAICAFLAQGRIKNRMRIHRTVVLPDFQGIGIGWRFTEYCASIARAVGREVSVTASHPAFIGHCRRSKNWRFLNRSFGGHHKDPSWRKSGAALRATSSLLYVGKAHKDKKLAQALWDGT